MFAHNGSILQLSCANAAIARGNFDACTYASITCSHVSIDISAQSSPTKHDNAIGYDRDTTGTNISRDCDTLAADVKLQSYVGPVPTYYAAVHLTTRQHLLILNVN